MLNAEPIEALVTGLHLRWDGVWQRPNHVLTRLAERVPVLVVEEPIAADVDATSIELHAGVAVMKPQRRHADDAIDAPSIAAARRWVGSRRAAVWLYTPMMFELATAFESAPLVYDKMDQLAAFLGADPRIEARERATLERAAVVFAGGASLWDTVKSRARRGVALPSGVDVTHFARALTAPEPEVLRGVRHPVLGYVGVIDERLDLALIERLADACSDATLVFVGPIVKISPASLPRRPNIVYLGKRTYAELPALLGTFDVALMPFAMGSTTQFISPTKTLEYLAAGREVVSTAVPDVVAAFSDVVHVANSPDAFIAAVKRAAPSRLRRLAADEKVRAMTWDGIVARMLAELAGAGVVLADARRNAALAAPAAL